MKNQEKSTRSNQSVTKALRILEAMADHCHSIRLKDLAQIVGLPESTTLRLLLSLMENGYVAQELDTQNYRLTYKIVQIGNFYRSGFSVIETIHPYLKKLSNICEESTCLAIELAGKAVHIDSVEGPNNVLKTIQKVGRANPMYSSGIGKCLLLNYSPQKLRALFTPDDFVKMTPHTIDNVEDLILEVEKTRQQGYAIDNEEFERGSCCIAAPIYDMSKKVIASISVSGPKVRMDEKWDEVREALLKIVEEISGSLNMY
ncbi:IclR family transcriptional regulator [Lachnospiraceae bacterium 62-35]